MHMLSENIEDNGCRKYQTGLIRRITKTERTLTHFSIADEVVRMKKSSKRFVRSLRNPSHYSIFKGVIWFVLLQDTAFGLGESTVFDSLH